MRHFLSHPYIHLTRLNKPVGIWLLLLPCWWGVFAYSSSPPPLSILALFTFGSIFMRSAGCILNDIADRNIDAQVDRTRTRPLVAHTVTLREARTLLTVLLFAASIVASMLGWRVLILGACWLPLIALYPLMKRWTWWPQAFLGVTFGAGSLFGMVAVTGNIHYTGLLLYAATICWVIGYDTIYACQDRVDDQRIGVKSTALLFGHHIRFCVGVCYTLTVALLLAAFINTHPDRAHALPLLAAATLLGWQVKRLNPENSTLCLHLFKQNTWVGVLVCAAFA